MSISLFHNFRHFNIKTATAHHSIIQQEVDELLAKGVIEPSLMVLVFTHTFLLFLSVLMAYIPSTTLSVLITICTYLALRCLLSDKCGFLYNREIMLFLLISRMFIHIFLLFSITIIFEVSLAAQTLLTEGFAFCAGYSP